MMARSVARVAGGEATHLALVIALTSYWFFVFFGSYGPVSQLLAIGSKYFLFPISVMYLSARYRLPAEAQRRWQTAGNADVPLISRPHISG